MIQCPWLEPDGDLGALVSSIALVCPKVELHNQQSRRLLKPCPVGDRADAADDSEPEALDVRDFDPRTRIISVALRIAEAARPAIFLEAAETRFPASNQAG